MTPKKILITPVLHAKLLRERSRKSKIYLLGKNNLGVCTTAIKLKRDGGCNIMPRIGSSVITVAGIQMIKKGITPAAFAYSNSCYDRMEWGYGELHETAIYRNRGVVFMEFCQGVSARVARSRGSKLYNVEIGIVSAKNKKPDLSSKTRSKVKGKK